MPTESDAPSISSDSNESQDLDNIYYEPYDEKLVEWFVDLIKTHDKLMLARNVVLNRHFGELSVSANLEEQEKLLLIHEYINKELVYPPVFLGSSLGFNKNNWNKNIEKILEPYGIRQKPVFCAKDTCYLFERMKYLILKYMEKIRK
ncbi:hypothetical protein NEPAR06_0349 [Nematocida parisii]|uniref:Uncharacterized protein n=1 Tax=Nematocida parisii (strain ERTm3) TaxID=935791 RepID=I3EG97_NEMP3|nr:uncharacterized protein NEPG_01262 [Nematocida parisii ERTm1]EIJ88244.1 hypothetical protein NEQG_01688 [Nematocida parisii ERTm3]KAI5125375.1 hypothetical protein NEPAR03_0050 [Nematocida parisii]EIJ93690.1 hypothetical protein NEPG_01262 [Nematocida parisii ERTm1]KAI5125499.1 hypothetical protein NEPAR08_0050 [Nematocida parisii]KAI5140619.1 hypothetical protein NEPAR04_0360 [Nematocida parisii]|eukprot:XP_013059090.1 hypothetical protein NEPG_01262 [Nematocida parisii ERTm1]